MKQEQGFTLVELLIAVAIAALLLFVVFPSLSKLYQKSKNDQSATTQKQSLTQTEVTRLATFNAARDVPIKNLIFYREPRVPDLCVAYGWINYADGGPVAFEVNCEKVEGLLINPSPPEKQVAAKPTCPPNCGPL